MKAIIMAAGKGTRLKPLTDIIPKPLVPIGFKNGVMYTILEKLIAQIKLAGITDIAVVVNYKKELIKEYLKDGSCFGVRISYYEQEELNGNAGAIYCCGNFIDDDILFTDADNFVMDENVFACLRNVFDKSASVSAVGVVRVDNPRKYAIFKEDKKDKLIDIFEKPQDASWGNLAKSGFGIISKEIAQKTKEISKTSEGEYTTTQIFKHIISNDLGVDPFVINSKYADIGTWDEYRMILKSNI